MKVFDLKPELVSEMSLVFKSFDGKEYAPRNTEAMVLAVKGGEKQSFISKAVDAIKKAYFPNGEDFPVSEATDDIDNDGDGPEDYNAICDALCNVSWDLQQAMGITDAGARSIAIKVAVDSFVAQFKSFIGVEKAGARHSKADKEHIAAMQDAHKKMGEHLAALAPADEDAADGGKDDASEPDAKKADEVEPAAEPIAEITEDAPVATKAEEIDMTQEELDAKISAAVAEAVSKATQANADAIEAAKAQARAEADASAAVALKAAQVEAEQAKDFIKSASIAAAAPAGTSAHQAAPSESRLSKVLKAQLAQNPESHAF